MPSPRRARRRLARRVALLALTALALMLTTQQAVADGRELHAVDLPSLSSIGGWFKDPHWGKLPHQDGGTAAGHRHHVPAARTAAHRGAGHARGKGRGELSAYKAHKPQLAHGRSGHPRGHFNAATSKRNAKSSSRTVTVFDNADGSQTRRISPQAVNYRTKKGTWSPIDSAVRAGPAGRWYEKANSLAVDFAPRATDPAVVSFAKDENHGLAYGLSGAAPVTGSRSADGSHVTYPGVLPHTDLQVAATATGVKEAIVLDAPEAAHEWTFPLHLDGLTPVQLHDGSIDLRDAAGKTVERIPHAYAYDAKVDRRSGDPATTYDVAYRLRHGTAGWSLTVALDPAWLRDPARRFPVTVDPTVVDGWTTTYAESGYDQDHSFEQTIKAGSYDAGPHSAAAYINHWDTAWDGSKATVTAASLHLFDTWAATCTATRFDVALVTKAWTPEGVHTYPGPAYGASIGNATPSVPHACANTAADRTVGDDVTVKLSTSAIQGWFNGTTPDYGLAVYAATNDTAPWKQFGSFNDPGKGPYLDVTYTGTTPPQVYEQFPADNAVVHTTTPELTAWSGGADSQANTTTKYLFQVFDAQDKKVADSGLQAKGDWIVPAGKLKWNTGYYWTVQGYDGGMYSDATPYSLSVQVPEPVITSGLSQNSSDHGFDASIGNYTTSDTDASISTAGPSLDVERDYNSRDPRWNGAFGAGWSSILDSRATEQYTPAGAVAAVNVTYPDGSQVGYGKNSDGTFTPGSGRFATFKAVTGGYTLTDKDDTLYTFTQSLGSGGYGLTSVTDADGRAVKLTWTSGHVSRMASSVSGRALGFTWSTPSGAAAAHVATVVTDPVTPGDTATAQTWTYGYNGDQLTKVCSPLSASKCTTYGYTSGSHYRNASLDLDPHGLWQLAETSGTKAKDAVLANQGTNDATYEHVTLGAAGPFAGSRGATFDGATSDVVLPDNLGNDTDSGALSLWFKTSAGPGILYSYASQPITSGEAAGFYTPALYVGKDGKLNAEFWYSGGINPIVTSVSVADGKWHHVVLSAAGNSQTLFLDNAKVGSRTGTVSIKSATAFGKNQVFNYLGTGYLGGDWPDAPAPKSSDDTDGHPVWFKGTLADAAFYDHPLVAADVNALYQYGSHPAALLSSVKRPSGKTFAAMTYDGDTAALTQLTDENGGTWKLQAPTVAGSSQTYRGAVLGQNPAQYYRLGEAAGASTAVDEVRGGDATYTSTTLGSAGPFSDAKAATFNGTSSVLTLPTGAVPGVGAESLSMWFKTSTANGGVLLGTSKDAFGATTPTHYTPVLYVGSSGKLHGEFYFTGGTTKPLASTASVADGKWHHVVLATSATSQSLYLDDKAVGAQTGTAAQSGQDIVTLGSGFNGGSWPDEPHSSTTVSTGYASYFNGSIADVSFHRAQLSADDVDELWGAAKKSGGLLPAETVKVTTPTGSTATYTYDVTHGGRALTETDGLGAKTSFGYDTAGFEHTVTDPNGVVTVTGHDVRGNIVSSTTCQDQAKNHCSTEYYTYYPDDTTAQLTTADPRNDQLLTSRDGRSASASDTSYLTSYTYDANGDQTAITGPAVPGFPDGRTTTTVYADGTSAFPATGGGSVPKGLPVRTVSPGGAVNSVAYFKNGDVASTTDAGGLVTTYTYDGLGQVLSQKAVSDTYPDGLTTTYVYDDAGQVVEEHDPQLTDRVTGATHAAVTKTVFDEDGDVLSQSVSDASGGDKPRTEAQTYDAYDRVATETDANGTEGAANGNTTTYTYDTSGNRVKEVDSAGTETRYTYDDNGELLTQTLMTTGDPDHPSDPTPLVESSRAYDPSGRLASVTDAMGNTTAYTYTDDGLTATVTRTSADGKSSYVLESHTYDAAGNTLSTTEDNGETLTTFKVDAADRTTESAVDPGGVNRVSTVSYTPDDEVGSENDHDSSGWSRTTTSTYDAMGNVLKETLYGDASGHPAGWWKLDQDSGRHVTDASGTGNTAAVSGSGVTWGDGAANFSGAADESIATNGPVVDTTASYTVSAWVKLSSLPTKNATVVAQSGSNNSAFMLQYNYAHTSAPLWSMEQTNGDAASGVTFPSAYGSTSTKPTTGTWTHLVGVYDSSDSGIKLYVNGSLAGSGTNTSAWSASGPLTIGRALYAGNSTDQLPGSVANVQVYPRTLSASEVTSLYGKGRAGGTVGSSGEQTTTYTYDKRGLPLTETDAEHHTTEYAYDEAGNLATTTAPAVQAEPDGTEANRATVRPVTASGFNTFGEATEEEDPNGLVTTTAYDANGQKVSETLPPYTPDGESSALPGTTVYTYDSEGNQTSVTTPAGRTTSYAYDRSGNLTRTTLPDGSSQHATYDAAGDALSATDATGGESQATYDFLGRQLTATTLERKPVAKSLTTTSSYAVTDGNPYGAHLAMTTSPGGVTASYGYNRAGDVTSVTDGAGNTTRYTYDFQGNQQKTTLPDGTWTEVDYNASDDPTDTYAHAADNSVLTHTSNQYDGVGNLTAATDANGHTTRWTYDAAGTITQQIEPVDANTSLTTSFGYDAAGNRTRFTDGRGNNWRYAYTPWGQQSTVTEPTTSRWTSAADSTTRFVYDADGRMTRATLPGGTSTSMTYDDIGQLTRMSGQGADAATASRGFTYDKNGRLTVADTDEAGIAGAVDHQAATHETFGYDDRGDLLDAAGSAGASSFTYNADAQMLTRKDAAGTTSYSYDTAGRLASLDEPATGTRLTYSYGKLDELRSISYGSGGQTRTFSYDDDHQLTGDILTKGATTLASFAYGHDPNGNLTAKKTTGVTGAAANTYTYDWSDRITSWNDGTKTTAYKYDASGNRVQVGADVYTYDARDELTSDGKTTYEYSARGTLTAESSATGTNALFRTDAFGDQIVAGEQSYTQDALGRNLTDTNTAESAGGSRTFAYSGADNTIASDDDSTYTYDPAGGLTGVKDATGGVLALTDQHNDVVGTFGQNASALTGSATYDPLGKVLASNAMSGHLGFQSGWTEPGTAPGATGAAADDDGTGNTGNVGTASRWYDPHIGQFLNKDSLALGAIPDSVAANPFAYVDDNPLAGTDESGNCSWYDVVCGAKKVAHKAKKTAKKAVHKAKKAAHKVYHAAKHVARKVVHTVKHAVHKAVHKVRDYYRSTVRVVRRVYHYTARHVKKAAHRVVHAVHTAYHKVKKTVHRVVHAAKKTAHKVAHTVKKAAHAVPHAARTAYHATVKAAKSTATFVKHHAAAITSFVVSTAVFAGCEAVTGGVGSIGCAAVAGAAGSLVTQGFACAQSGGDECSVGAFAGSAAEGALAGAAGGLLGKAGGALLAKAAPKAMKVVGGLFGRGATDAGESAAADATDQAALAQETRGAVSESGSRPGCTTPHSFTGATRVLLADGTTKPIDQVKVGDTIANAVPGLKATEAHQVTAVIVTRTDRDFVDVKVRNYVAKKPRTSLSEKARAKARRAAVTLTALGALAGAAGPAAASGPASASAPVSAPASASTPAELHTTFHHPFYDVTRSAFVEAKDLHKGDLLQTPTGAAEITGVRLYHAHSTTYDLTVGKLHTYYVLAGTTPVLVHNCNEVFHRAMSEKEFNQLGPNGEITVRGTENFVTQDREYLEGLRYQTHRKGGRNAEKYTVLVRYEMSPGARDALIAVGKSPGEIGHDVNAVHLKSERGFDTYGLRPGSVGVFNSRIVGFGRVEDW
ncbi:intein C-terminal splicing region [Streptomyces sp. TverLS-915]|uniref:LamG-like jellyroll fold domain-containing protein n=1 Tax=Streptomyces sp. TverLS-915 TaxID=1839763 RepID=UPI00081E9E4F|nr:LamG-like jellyroll fold domain-containing protein [Streptomyces sp. TverLS-915]SCD50642.1 intein C-terminal splicing region [Streptomyces sp. TverLS-915]